MLSCTSSFRSLGTLIGAECDAEHWSAEIEVHVHDTKFKLDTGAAVSMVSDRETWLQSENLLTTKQTLRGQGGTLLPVMGVIKARLRHRNKSLNNNNGRNGSFLRGWLPHGGNAHMACNYCFPTRTMF